MRPIHPDFLKHLELKDQKVIDLFKDIREFILFIYPESTELLYHTHALTSVFCVSDKLSDAFCMIPIYTNHLNLGFNKGTLLDDSNNLLTGTGKLIRHIPIEKKNDYRNEKVALLLKKSIEFALYDTEKPNKSIGLTISKIKS